MTPAQFTALAELLRLRDGSAQEAARLVLVDGLSAADAAREVGMSYIAAFKAVQRVQAGLTLAKAASGNPGGLAPQRLNITVHKESERTARAPYKSNT